MKHVMLASALIVTASMCAPAAQRSRTPKLTKEQAKNIALGRASGTSKAANWKRSTANWFTLLTFRPRMASAKYRWTLLTGESSG